MRILVTGAAGSIGSPLVDRLRDMKHLVSARDIDTLDVTNEAQVEDFMHRVEPHVVYHLAGAKHAPDGEHDPEHVVRVNVAGTANIVRHARNAKVVLASTCKAADPETAYGASKLVAERIVLNAGGVVVRYYNVRETAGNVFRLWERIPQHEPIPWTDCWRYFITLEQAVALTVAALELPQGRYTVDPGLPRHMLSVANDLYPQRVLRQVPVRRGDRKREPLHARCETVSALGGLLLRIDSPYDPPAADELKAAA